MSPPGLLTVWDASFASEEAVVRQGDLIEKLIHQIDRRFEQGERRIERIDKRISLMFTVMTSITSLVGAGVVVAQFIG